MLTIVILLCGVIMSIAMFFAIHELETVFEYLVIVVCIIFIVVAIILVFVNLRKDFISTMTIASDGISVRCYGKPWFTAYWGELYMGEYMRPYRFGGEALMYFSKKPVEYRDLQDYAYRLGNNHKSKGDIVFLVLSPKSKQEILKYVESKDIIQHGLVDAVKAPKQNRNNQD